MNQEKQGSPSKSEKKKQGRSWKFKILAFFSVISGVCFLAVLGWLYSLGVLSYTEKDLKAITEYKPMDNSVVYDRDGEKIGELFSSYYIFTPLNEIPETMIQAVVAIEDRRFESHLGIDPIAMFRALITVLREKRMSQGASTITQQLVRNIILSREKTIERKVKEIALSLMLETKLEKDKILEIYMNALFLGNGAYGVNAAAYRYFGKAIHELELHEHALIAGLFQSPSAYNPHRFPARAKNRQKKVIISMARAGFISVKQAKQEMKKKLEYLPYTPLNGKIAPHFIDYIQERTNEILKGNVKNRGLRIFTTLDQKLQKIAQESIVKSHMFLESTKVHLLNRDKLKEARIEAAILSTDPRNGHILAMVGGRDYKTSQFNRTVHARRSPGSSIKPIVYSLALREGHKWSDVHYVSPVAVKDYRPKNYSEDSFLTETTLIRALYRSINTLTVEIADELGLDEILEHSKLLGIQSPLKKEIGTVLGGSEVTMMDMARLYGTFANQGKQVELVAIARITDRDGNTIYEAPDPHERTVEALNPQVSYLMQEGLRTVFKRGTAQQFSRHAAYAVGKTGTSNNAKDNWFCGYTPSTVSISWVGVEKSDGFEEKVSGSTLALPLWSFYMDQAIKHRKPPSSTKPDGIVKVGIDPRFGYFDPYGVKAPFFKGQSPKTMQSNLRTISRTGSYRNIFNR